MDPEEERRKALRRRQQLEQQQKQQQHQRKTRRSVSFEGRREMRKLTLVNRVDRSKTDGDTRPMPPSLSALFGTDCGTVNEGGYPKPPPIKPSMGVYNGGKRGLNIPHDLATLTCVEAAYPP